MKADRRANFGLRQSGSVQMVNKGAGLDAHACWTVFKGVLSSDSVSLTDCLQPILRFLKLVKPS